MPIFEYKCNKCQHITSFLEKAGSRAVHKCEECGSDAMKKIFSTFSAQSGGSAPQPGPGCGGCTSDCQFAGGR